jgi:2-keto-4-pentenoate hydratase
VLKDQWLKPGAWVTRPPGSKIQLAPALGFTLERAITAHIGTPTELPPMVRDVRPVVILVDYSFDDTAPPTALDLVAANGAPARLIVGQPFKSTDAAMIDATFVEMHREDQVVVRGKATNVMGGQYEALRWQVNELLARGWTLKAGQLLVTGPLSEPVPADVGDWKADYWERGALDFSVEYGRPR